MNGKYLKIFKQTNNGFEFGRIFLPLFFGYYFLLLFAVMMSRGSYIPAHTAESLYLGLEMQLGYSKHPPLHAVIPYLFWNLFNYSYYAVYFFTAALLTSGVIGSYFLSKKFLNNNKAILATLIYCGVLAINFLQLKINANTILFPIYPLIVLFFYNSIKTQKISCWALFGFCAALGMLGKYSTIVLLFCCFLITTFTPQGRISYKKTGIYVGILFFGVVCAPHVIWLFYHYKPALTYFSSSAFQKRNVPAALYLGMLGVLSIAIGYWLLFVESWKKPFAKVKGDVHFDTKFLVICCIAPILCLMVLPILGVHVKTHWTSAFYFGIGTVLIYFSNINLSLGVKIRHGVVAVLCTYSALGILCILCINMTGYDNKYELHKVSQYVYDKWSNQFHTNPSYICHSNDIEAIAAIKLMHDIYEKTREKHKIHLILNCNFKTRPEIDLNDVRAKGLITFTDHDAEIASQIFGSEPVFSNVLLVAKYPKLKASQKSSIPINFYFSLLRA